MGQWDICAAVAEAPRSVRLQQHASAVGAWFGRHPEPHCPVTLHTLGGMTTDCSGPACTRSDTNGALQPKIDGFHGKHEVKRVGVEDETQSGRKQK